MEDEPFAAGPAVFASYIAAVILERYDEALGILDAARIANPDDWEVLNNTAFCFASDDDPEEAEKYFVKLNPSPADDTRHGVWLATKGLILFRSGDKERGRAYYKEAIAKFDRTGNPTSRALATYFWAREELLASTAQAADAIAAAESLAKVAGSPEVPYLVSRLRGRRPNEV
jgi:tetratricopeptide (TPR) repeat protein